MSDAGGGVTKRHFQMEQSLEQIQQHSNASFLQRFQLPSSAILMLLLVSWLGVQSEQSDQQ